MIKAHDVLGTRDEIHTSYRGACLRKRYEAVNIYDIGAFVSQSVSTREPSISLEQRIVLQTLKPKA